MSVFLNILSWIFCVLFALLALMVFGMGGRLQFFLILGIVLTLAPPFRHLLQDALAFHLPWWAFVLSAILLWTGVMLSFVLNPPIAISRPGQHRHHR